MTAKNLEQHFKVRFAVEADLGLILEFIRELAAFEHMSDQVTATEDVLRESLFRRKDAEVLIGEYDGEPVGFVLFFHNFSTFLGRSGLYLEDLYIRPAMRGKGLGRLMFANLARIAKERECGRMEWWCLDWNERAIRFYKKLGAEAMDEWTVYRVTGDSLDKLAEGR